MRTFGGLIIAKTTAVSPQLNTVAAPEPKKKVVRKRKANKKTSGPPGVKRVQTCTDSVTQPPALAQLRPLGFVALHPAAVAPNPDVLALTAVNEKLNCLENSHQELLTNQQMILDNQAQIIAFVRAPAPMNQSVVSPTSSTPGSQQGRSDMATSVVLAGQQATPPTGTYENQNPAPNFQNIPLSEFLSVTEIDDIQKHSLSRTHMATNLLQAILKSAEAIAHKNVQGLKGKSRFCPRRIGWIRKVLSVKFPPVGNENEQSNWRNCRKNIDAFARAVTRNISTGRNYVYCDKKRALVLCKPNPTKAKYCVIFCV